jgi:MinD-like ATPase involved in chromosome partitioning or flagellar assembly
MQAEVRVAGDSGKPIVRSHPDSSVAKALVSITQQIAAQLSLRAVRQPGTIPLEMID